MNGRIMINMHNGVFIFILYFDKLYLTNGKLLDSFMRSFFITYNLNIDLLFLRAIGFIKSHVYRDFN
jgi:hypothetical protein